MSKKRIGYVWSYTDATAKQVAEKFSALFDHVFKEEDLPEKKLWDIETDPVTDLFAAKEHFRRLRDRMHSDEVKLFLDVQDVRGDDPEAVLKMWGNLQRLWYSDEIQGAIARSEAAGAVIEDRLERSFPNNTLLHYPPRQIMHYVDVISPAGSISDEIKGFLSEITGEVFQDMAPVFE